MDSSSLLPFPVSLTVALGFSLGVIGMRAQAQQPDDTTETEPVHVQARTLRGAMEGEEAIRRLIGNVRLQQGQTHLWSDRATQYLERSEILFLGDVLIVERGDTLRADRVLYDSQRKSGKARGNVRLSDGQVQVRAPTGRYFAREKRARFNDGLTFVDSATTVTSETGTYFSDEKRAIFQQNVRLRKPETRMQSDSLTYWRDRETARARGHVLVEHIEADSASASPVRTFLYGDRAYTDEPAGLSRATGRPLLIRLRPDSAQTDTLLMRAAQLTALRTDTLRRLMAVDSVRIWQGRRLAAVSDSAVSTRRSRSGDESHRTMRLFGDPLAWHDATQISGDTIRFTGTGEELKRLFVPTRPFVVRPDTATGRLNQLKGRRLVGRFHEGALRTVGVGPNAEAVYFMTNDHNQPDGAVKASGDSIAFVFRGDSLQTIRVLGGVEGTQYSENQLPSKLRLEGFQWFPERRPAKDTLIRRLPPDLRPLPAPDTSDAPAPPLVRRSPPARGLPPSGN